MEKVVVGMSGGVDSSVVALLLKNEGYEVFGVTLDIWQDENSLARKSSINDAKKICEKLNIKHDVFDVKDLFKENVIDPFVNEYINGKTPNPCVRCNKFLKFEALIKYAEKIGVNKIATGHYANVDFDSLTGRYFVQKSISDKKDQSYVLYDLTQSQLEKIIMPLGKYTKDEIRKIASENGFINADKKDSQEICFVENNDYVSYIIQNYKYHSKIGNFVDVKGNVLGKHKGIINYTIGQRKGLGLSFKCPMYVKKIDKEKNEVVLATEDELKSKNLICVNLNFMKIADLNDKLKVKAKIRYNAKEAEAIIYKVSQDKVKVEFLEDVKSVAPGQAVVFYDDERCVVGGGIIL